MEQSEAGLELLTQKLSALVETKLQALNSTEVSTVSCKLPKMKTMLEYRDQREKFLQTFNEPLPIPKITPYSEVLINESKQNVDLPSDTSVTLKIFFDRELKRVSEIRDTVMRRIKNNKLISENNERIIAFMKSISQRLFQCESGKLRLTAAILMTFNFEDLVGELNSTYCDRLRNGLLDSIKNQISLFPITAREQIATRILESVTESVSSDREKPQLTFYLENNEQVELEMKRLAKVFSITADINANDGQQYLYCADKVFNKFWPSLDISYPIHEVDYEFIMHPRYTMEMLTTNSILMQVTNDVKISSLFESIFLLREDEVRAAIKEQVRFYKAPIIQHKLIAWMELRFANMKYLAVAIRSLLNYFEMIRSNEDFVARSNPQYPQLIETIVKGKAVEHSNTEDAYQACRDLLVRLGSYYTERVEQNGPEVVLNVDREALVEKLLQLMYRFLNAKRCLLEPLLEAAEHHKNQGTLDAIKDTLDERPNIVLHMYRSFETSFNMSIKLLEKKAKMIRFLLDLQINHERNTGANLGDAIPLFDRPVMIGAEKTHRAYAESVPISPFEVYHSLSKVSEILKIVPEVAREFVESMDIRGVRFGTFVEIAVWDQVDKITSNASCLLPYDKCAQRFNFMLSDSVDSLFHSPYVNRLDSVGSIVENMNEGRRLRFYLSLRRFLNLTWQLQDEVIRTNALQTAYFESCDLLNITDRSVILSTFNETAKSDTIDIGQQNTSDKVMDFALTEFESVTVNFCSLTDIKDLIIPSNYEQLKRMIIFQRLQNSVLEIACRYNSVLTDSDRLVQYFELVDGNTDVFLTQTENSSRPSEEQESKFAKQLIAPQLFYNSITIFRDNQAAQADKHSFFVCISTFKSRARTILSAQVKQKEYTLDDLFELYRSEIIETFASSIYKYEMMRIFALERRLLLTNSFIDTFHLGPENMHLLINEAGRFEDFFYIPTWVEAFQMMATAPAARQSLCLKYGLEFVTYRLLIMNLVRFECSIDMNKSVIFGHLFYSSFQMEGTVFQKLLNEFGRLPNGRETDAAARYIGEKYQYYFSRLELAVLLTIQGFYGSLKVDTMKKSKEKNQVTIGVGDPHFGDTVKSLWTQFHESLPSKDFIVNENRYVPMWMRQFIHGSGDGDRIEFRTNINGVDSCLEEVMHDIRGSTFDTFQILPTLVTYLRNTIAQTHIKYAYYLLLSHVPERVISLKSSVSLINQKHVINGNQVWDSVIIPNAHQSLVPKDGVPRTFEAVPEPKHAQAIFDVVRNEVDSLILSNQIKKVEKQVEEVTHKLQSTDVKNALMLKPTFNVSLDPIDGSLKPVFVITPRDAEAQYEEEKAYSTARLVNFVSDALDATTLERRNHGDTFTTIFDADVFEETVEKLSSALNVFEEGCLDDFHTTWDSYLSSVCSVYRDNQEETHILDIIEAIINKRFTAETEANAGFIFGKQFKEINVLRDRLAMLKASEASTVAEITANIEAEYEELCGDLKAQISRRKNEFHGIKRQVLDDVAKRIMNARGVQLTVDKARGEGGTAKGNMEELEQVKAESAELRQKIVKMRIIRTLNEIALRRIFEKKVDSAIADRRQANSSLFSNRLMYESQEEMMENQLHESHIRLAETEIEIERLKQLLENEKMSNIQLVHWKAKNEKTAVRLKEELSKIEIDEDYNIGELLRQIEERQKELDLLRAEGEEMEALADSEIRRPMEEVGKLRKEIRATRISSVSALSQHVAQTKAAASAGSSPAKREAASSLLSNENIRLKHENELLRQKIEEALTDISARSVTQKRFMEGTLKQNAASATSLTKSSLAKSVAKKGIVTPNVPPRSISRI